MEWTMPAFAFPAEAGTHSSTPEGWKAELALVGSLWVYVYQSLHARAGDNAVWTAVEIFAACTAFTM